MKLSEAQFEHLIEIEKSGDKFEKYVYGSSGRCLTALHEKGLIEHPIYTTGQILGGEYPYSNTDTPWRLTKSGKKILDEARAKHPAYQKPNAAV